MPKGREHDITLEQLQEMGVRSSTMRYYLWFKHFVETGDLDIAAYFLGKCWRRHGHLPESWSAMRDELDEASKPSMPMAAIPSAGMLGECNAQGT